MRITGFRCFLIGFLLSAMVSAFVSCRTPSPLSVVAVSERVDVDTGGDSWFLWTDVVGQEHMVRESLMELMVSPVSSDPVCRWHKLEGTYRVSFHARADSSVETAKVSFWVQRSHTIPSPAEDELPLVTYLYKTLTLDEDGVLVDAVFTVDADEARGGTLICFSSSDLNPFVISGFMLGKVELGKVELLEKY